jgi:pSer/pThr/pTyr-binding forkhead associated (FHA) protein/tetratricopeptide (TPR) repeat protein
MGIVRFRLKTDPDTYFETREKKILIGRSADCEIVINDPHASRIQARISVNDERYHLQSLGKNPTRINHTATAGQFLVNGDLVTIGKTDLIFEIADGGFEHLKMDQSTVAVAGTSESVLYPRLILGSSNGIAQVFQLSGNITVLGRSENSDIRVEDSSVSRQHCRFEKRADIFYVLNISQINPVTVNGSVVSEQRLYNGDRISVGDVSMAFISDRPEDQKPPLSPSIASDRGGIWIYISFAAGIILLVGVYIVYRHAYEPFIAKRTLANAEKSLQAGDVRSAERLLEKQLKGNLKGENLKQARGLMATAALMETEGMVEQGKLNEAAEKLAAHLKNYAGGEETEKLQNRLDLLYIEIGEMREAAGDYRAALEAYAEVSTTGPYSEDVQQRIRSAWLAIQQRLHHQEVAELLKEAEGHFRARRYLTPVDQSSYAIYRAILIIDPNNRIARQRIDQMKVFYREQGQKYMDAARWHSAMTYFERLSLIDPEDSQARNKIEYCRQQLYPHPSAQEKRGD